MDNQIFSEQVSIWNLDYGNGNYDVVTIADIKTWKKEAEQKKQLENPETIPKGEDVPF